MKNYKTKIVQPMGDHNDPYPCVKSKDLEKYLKLDYEYLNPVQSDFVKYLEDFDTNIVIASPTSSGKTVCAEFFAAEAIKNHSKRVLYLAPMKALADEKYSEWTNKKHSFSKYNVEIQTGDFELSDSKKNKLIEADIIILTPEMFNSKCRFYENHPWIHDSVLVCDETHLIGMPGRGSNLEVGIMDYFDNNKDSRALFISATLPNVKDFEIWLEHLTGKKTVIIESDYRPCKLNVEFVEFNNIGSSGRRMSYADQEMSRQNKCIELIKKYKKHPILVFTGSKDFGNKLLRTLKVLKINARFHNADLERSERKEIESGFMNGDFNIMVSTSTTSWGCNTPARYVIMSHTCFGLTPMHPANIIQSVGRAGRSGYSERGDALILVPGRTSQQERIRIFSNYKLDSVLNDVNILTFHILTYIVNKKIKNSKDLLNWYKKSFSSIQKDQIREDNAQRVLDTLAARGMIRKGDDGNYVSTILGDITSKMYMSPMDVSDWFRNFSEISYLNPTSQSFEEKTNLDVAKAFGKCYSWGVTWVNNRPSFNPAVYISKREQNSPAVINLCSKLKINPKDNPYCKYIAIFYEILSGRRPPMELSSYYYGIYKDIERMTQTLKMADEMLGKHLNSTGKCKGFGWGNEWDKLFMRLKYNISSNLIELVQIDGIGKSFAEKLYSNGIKNKSDLYNPKNREKISKILGKKRSEKILKI